MQLTSILLSAIAVISVFAVVIISHEAGHYIVAKRYGVAVPAFAIGFGPKLLTWFWSGTEFSVRLFPIGGMVQLAGEFPQDTLCQVGDRLTFHLDTNGRICAFAASSEILRNGRVGVLREFDLSHRLQMTLEMEDGVHTYAIVPGGKCVMGKHYSIPIVGRNRQVLGKPLWQRASMILAGPIMNFLLAGILFSILNLHTGVQLNDPVVGSVQSNTPAAKAGFVKGDRVLSANGVSIASWRNLVQMVSTDINTRPIIFKVKRNNVIETLIAQPKLVVISQRRYVPQIGINGTISHDPTKAVADGFSSVISLSVKGLQTYAQVLYHHQLNNLVGPVGIARQISREATHGFWYVIMMTGLLSMNLGLFNLMPIPALDGARLLFLLVEIIRGKSIDPRNEGMAHLVGFAVLILFSVVITYRDVTRIF